MSTTVSFLFVQKCVLCSGESGIILVATCATLRILRIAIFHFDDIEDL